MLLHLISRVVGLLGWCAGLYSALVLAWTLWKGSRPKHAVRWMSWIEYRNKKFRGWVRLNEIPISLSVAGVVLVSLVLVTAASTYPVEEWHNVSVLAKVGDNQWWMKTATGPNSTGVMFTACPDFPNERVIWAGYIADKIRFEEEGKCKSIRREGLGVWWERDPQNNYEAKEIH